MPSREDLPSGLHFVWGSVFQDESFCIVDCRSLRLPLILSRIK